MKYLNLRLKKNGKVPLVAGAFGGEDFKLIQSWVQEGGNVGTLTGSASGIAVIDIDTHKGVNGMGNLIEFLDTYDIELPKTTVVKTPSGGYHFYFKLDEKYNETQFLQNHPQLEGVDFQTHGRYVVAPPSQIDGKYYEVVRDVELAELPEKWLEMFTDKTITKKNKKREKKWTGQLMESILTGAGSGSRNIFLTSTIGKLFATGMNHDAVRVWSLYVNQISLNPPLSEEEVLRTYESVRKRELRRLEDN